MPTQRLTFGLEIEATRIACALPPITNGETTPGYLTETQYHTLMERHRFTKHFDRTITEENGEVIDPERCGEIITRPMAVACSVHGQPDGGSSISFDYSAAEGAVRDLCSVVGKVNKTCGIHIHIGKPVEGSSERSQWSDTDIRAWAALGILIEGRIFNLVPASRTGNPYCKKIGDVYVGPDFTRANILGHVASSKYQNTKRYSWLNLVETRRVGSAASRPRGTVEIRLLGNTKRFEYIWAWCKLWLKVGGLIAYTDHTHAILSAGFGSALDAEINEVVRMRQLPTNRRTASENVPQAQVRNYMERTAASMGETVASNEEEEDRATTPARASRR